MTDSVKPLLYTKHGNVDAETLTRHVEWDFTRDGDDNVTSIKCRVFYTDADGDIVKDGADVYIATGVAALADAQTF
jgi:hypothetical protein